MLKYYPRIGKVLYAIAVVSVVWLIVGLVVWIIEGKLALRGQISLGVAILLIIIGSRINTDLHS